MSAPESRPSLASLERWFQEALVRPEVAARDLDHERLAPASTWIRPSAHLSPGERLDLYSGMYFRRMHEALASDYPALVHLAGAERFEGLVRAYLGAHPSRHYSLNFLGRELPGFLARAPSIPRHALFADVARLELAMTEVFDEQESPRLAHADLASIPPEAWERARPRLVAALRLVELGHRANAIVTAARHGQPLPALSKARTRVVVWRRDWTVWRMELEEPAFLALRTMLGGGTLQAAVEAAAAADRGAPQELAASVYRWFGTWVGEGFFRSIEV